MIKLENGGFLFLLPPNCKEHIENRCMAMVVDTLLKEFIKRCEAVLVWCDSENWSEKLCDQLAVELRTPLYDRSMDLKTKRHMVKKTLDWYKRLGTASVVKEVTETAWEGTGIEEWFQGNGRKAYTFRIKSKNMGLFAMQEALLERITEVKNVRSSLEGFLFTFENQIHVGSYLQTVEKVNIYPYQPKALEQENSVVMVLLCKTAEKICIKAKKDS